MSLSVSISVSISVSLRLRLSLSLFLSVSPSLSQSVCLSLSVPLSLYRSVSICPYSLCLNLWRWWGGGGGLVAGKGIRRNKRAESSRCAKGCNDDPAQFNLTTRLNTMQKQGGRRCWGGGGGDGRAQGCRVLGAPAGHHKTVHL
jgi:hypothetical protein